MSAAAARIADAPTITHGRYLQLRRVAASVSLEEAARAYTLHASNATSAEHLLNDAEHDRVTLTLAGLRRLQTRFSFDARIYLALAGIEEELDIPSICTGCGCTWDDACPGGCAWADKTETLCTACARPTGGRA